MFKFPNPEIVKVFSIGSITWLWNGFYWRIKTSDIIPVKNIDFLTDLKDVDIVDPYIGQAVVFNGEHWHNESIVNSINGSTGDFSVLSDQPTILENVQFDASSGSIVNLTSISGKIGLLTIEGNLLVKGNIEATKPGTTIIGDTEDTNPDNLDGGVY